MNNEASVAHTHVNTIFTCLRYKVSALLMKKKQ